MSSSAHNRWWERAAHAARSLETGLIVIVLGGLILLGAGQIVLRNVFSIGFAWGDGLARMAVLWLALLGAVAASRDGRHITMGALARWFPQGWQRLAACCADLFAAVVSGALAWYSAAFVNASREFGDLLLDDVPAWWLQIVMPFAFGLMACAFLVHALRRVFGAAEEKRG